MNSEKSPAFPVLEGLDESNAICDTVLESNPALNTMARRVYRDYPHGYPSFKSYMRMLAGLSFAELVLRVPKHQRPEIPAETSKNLGLQVSLYRDALRLGFPFWLVGRELMEAVTHTDPPKLWDTNQVRLPFRTFTLLFPEGSLVGDAGEIVSSVMVHLSPPPGSPLGEGLFRTTDETCGLFSVYAVSAKSGRCWWANHRVTDQVVDVETELPCTINDELSEVPTNPEAVQAFNNKLVLVCLQLIHLMNLTKSDRDTSHLIETENSVHLRKAGKGKEVWSTPWFGRQYTLARPTPKFTGNHHASPTFHWRRGHYAQQRFGKGLSQVKTIWRQPVAVNP
jgi:hypothetical protein